MKYVWTVLVIAIISGCSAKVLVECKNPSKVNGVVYCEQE